MPKKIITIYLKHPTDEQIRIAVDDEVITIPAKGKQEEKKFNEYRVLKNSMLSGVPSVIRNPVHVGIVDSQKIGEYFHALQDPKEGVELYIFPSTISHFYVENYIEKAA